MLNALSANDYPVITVVIPVYNIKPYLEKCVKSAVAQSYLNLEIILVDDGSTDGSELLCDSLEDRFERVNAIHKPNGGLASARNYGVDVARGNYIVFIDSDDYVDEDYVQYLWNLKISYHADIAVTGYIQEKTNGNVLGVVKSGHECLLSSQEALEKMCYGNELPIMAYGKLFNKKLLKKFPFPVGKMHEDIGVMYKLLGGVNKIALGSKTTYHYIKREGSIVNQTYQPAHLYSIEASSSIINYIKGKYPIIISAAYARLAIEAVSLSHRAANASRRDYEYVIKQIKLKFKDGLLMSLKNKKLPLRTKGQLLMLWATPGLYRKFYVTLKSWKRSVK